MDCTLRVGLPEDRGFRLLVQRLQEAYKLAWVRQVSNRRRQLAVMRRDEGANLPTGRRTKNELELGRNWQSVWSCVRRAGWGWGWVAEVGLRALKITTVA